MFKEHQKSLKFFDKLKDFDVQRTSEVFKIFRQIKRGGGNTI